MLRRRLFLSLLPLLVTLVAVGVYATVLFSRMANSVEKAVAENYRSVVAVQEMSLALSQMDRELWAAASSGNLGGKAFATPQARFEDNLRLQLKNNSLAGERALNQQLSSAYEEFQNALVQVSRPGKPEVRHQRYDLEVVPRLLKMKILLEQIRDLNQRAIVATGERAKNITREGIRLMGIGMAVALLISGWACYRFCRGLLQPIQLVTKASKELGEGNLTHPVPVLSRDELGDLALAFNKMAAQLQEYRQSTTEEIIQSHRTMETTLASFPDPIFVLDQDARIKLRNPAASVLTSSLHLDGQLPTHLKAAARQALMKGVDFLPDNFKEVVSYRMNGAEKHFLPRIMALRSKENTTVGVALVLYDVTRFRLIDAAKTDLVATVSHELKTPLTSVRMVLHILLEGTVGTLSPEQMELLQAARNDTERLLVILNDLLDLARLEEGKSDLNWEEVAPADLIHAVLLASQTS